MPVAIRLRREGNRNRPFYRIVVTDSRKAREGRYIEAIGTYNPFLKENNCTVNLEKADDWVSKGAHPSDTVKSLIKKARKTQPAAAEVDASMEAVAD